MMALTLTGFIKKENYFQIPYMPMKWRNVAGMCLGEFSMLVGRYFASTLISGTCGDVNLHGRRAVAGGIKVRHFEMRRLSRITSVGPVSSRESLKAKSLPWLWSDRDVNRISIRERQHCRFDNGEGAASQDWWVTLKEGKARKWILQSFRRT